MHGVASTNPLGLVLDIALTLAVSWVFAKVEESQYTRQPLLFFPLIKHGKPYQAGMTGAIRNSYWDSITSEWDKTTSTLSKAAAILEGSIVSGDDFTRLVSYQSTTTATGGSETRPRNIAFLPCIKI